MAAAQAPNLAGKNVQMVIGFGTGGASDLWGRLVARHIGRHLPGLPMERGEVDGYCGFLESVSAIRPDWITGKKVAVLFQGGTAPNPELKDVPFVNDLARTPEDRQAIEFLFAGEGLGRPFVAPPGMAPERAKM